MIKTPNSFKHQYFSQRFFSMSRRKRGYIDSNPVTQRLIYRVTDIDA